MVGTSEALLLGKSLGMDPKLLSSIINTSTGRNWSCDTYNPVPGILPNSPASKGYKGGFGAQLMSKDLNLALNSAFSVKSPVHLGSSCQQLYQHISRLENLQSKDFSVIYQFLSEGGAGKETK